MPAKNLEKIYAENTYYHLYNRGVNKQPIFNDKQDYAVFLNLFKRYLGATPAKDQKGREYPWYGDSMVLHAFCLMPNHFHLLIFQRDKNAMTDFLRAVNSSYGMYFNNKYKRQGPLFQSRFKASMIDSQTYLDHISRYIHLNPGKGRYQTWQPSSYQYYAGFKSSPWINTKEIIGMFSSQEAYLDFVADYGDMHDELDILKHELANY